MTLKIQKTKDYKGVLKKCYNTDTDFLNKYHSIKGITTEQAIEREYDMMNKAVTSERFDCYEIFIDKSFAGYFNLEEYNKKSFLGGFFILPNYRTKGNIIKFWQLIKARLDGDIGCVLYDSNIKAINFIKKAGFKVTDNKILTDCPAKLYTLKR